VMSNAAHGAAGAAGATGSAGGAGGDARGGGIYLASGSLTIDNSVLENNQAVGGAGGPGGGGAQAADGASGATAQLLPQFERRSDVAILFTGYINPHTPAERLAQSGRAQRMRWNVHPRLADTKKLARTLRARTIIPAFCDREQLAALADALAPAHVTMDAVIEI